MVNKKKGYETIFFHTTIRKTYYDQMKLMDQSMTDFLDEAIGKHLDVLDKSDEWILTQIHAQQKSIDGLKTLLNDRNKERKVQQIYESKLKNEYESFCDYLSNCPQGSYNTKRINKKYGVNLKDYAHFERLQKMNDKGGFNIEEFKKIRAG